MPVATRRAKNKLPGELLGKPGVQDEYFISLPSDLILIVKFGAFGYELRREMQATKNSPGARKRQTCRRTPESQGKALHAGRRLGADSC
jgi:hypothetical protein